ncbi:ABC transporter permease [Pelotomaculum propionicicum]|uniref:ABC transporter permease n=1 Tax=Pelotomaculum propionicicum TaxID=258475 RepID=UPI003B80D15D
MLKQCLAIARREFFFMWRDRDLRYILLIGPLLGLLIFHFTYSHQVLKDIPTAVVDLDRSRASQELVKNILGAENLKIIAYPDNYNQLEDLIKNGEVVAGLVIPENYGKDTSLSRQARVQMIVDGSNMVYATNATSAMLSVTRSLSAQAGVKALVARGIQPDQAAAAYQSVGFREEAWFNPTLNYAYFVVLALALNVWQQCCTLAACMNIIGETGAASWYLIKSSGFSRLRLFISKSAAQIITFMLIALPLFLLAFAVFKLPLRCGLPLFFLFNLAFATALHSVGTLASSIASSTVNATRFGMIIALPSFLVSGYSWPLDAMPRYLQFIAKMLPQTWYFQGINLLSFKDPGWAFMSRYFLAFLIIASVCYTTSALLVARRT